MTPPAIEPRYYGILAEFNHPDALVDATRQAYQAGFRCMDAYSPMPVHGLAEALGVRGTRLPFVVLVAGLCGTAFGYLLQVYMTMFTIERNVGGRPPHSWPAYVPVSFETTVLFASLAAVIGMFAMNGLPQPYHPVFNAPRFELASQDRFFLAIEAKDPKFDPFETRDFLLHLGAVEVTDVEE